MLDCTGTSPERTPNRGLPRGSFRAAIRSGLFLGGSAFASLALVGIGTRGDAPVGARADAKVIAMGKETYAKASCIDCHGADGQGKPGKIPPLDRSEWALGQPNRLVRIVTQGLCGPIRVKGQVYKGSMPSIEFIEDDELAALLTYLRQKWGNDASPVSPKAVAKTRAAIAQRNACWKASELDQVRSDED
jgi:mono/diheme cytochrome c family protein